uniref:Uncharacterized protein n=1 Tax=Rhizophora mucronata TaxID=61149 RepID=A0A2P2NR18_RHIMU
MSRKGIFNSSINESSTWSYTDISFLTPQ